MNTYYTTRGSVRGSCGHHHQSVATAQACLDRDEADCAGAGTGCYSDRRIVAVDDDGERDLDETEIEELCRPRDD
jgi:hypothetical protein